jgi:hypothetical protein
VETVVLERHLPLLEHHLLMLVVVVVVEGAMNQMLTLEVRGALVVVATAVLQLHQLVVMVLYLLVVVVVVEQVLAQADLVSSSLNTSNPPQPTRLYSQRLLNGYLPQV